MRVGCMGIGLRIEAQGRAMRQSLGRLLHGNWLERHRREGTHQFALRGLEHAQLPIEPAGHNLVGVRMPGDGEDSAFVTLERCEPFLVGRVEDPCFATNAADADVYTARAIDRKSTRLNSSHSQISYAVFCLKKKRDGRELPWH